ncbi:GIY-YIG nuclease family protein [Spirillospora sp. NPDC052242]
MTGHTVGFVYVLSNEAMPGIVKVGMTGNLAEDRAKHLHGTAVPLPFEVEFRVVTSFPSKVERKAHDILDPWRVAPNREFFRVSPEDATNAVKEALQEEAGILAWRSSEQHHIDEGDRVALSLKAGDYFVVLTYPNIMVERADILDVWEAHSDGDMLELMGTARPGHVAGFSDGDPRSEEDPVPYLDRSGTVANVPLFARERLVIGERLLWFRPVGNGESCLLTMFEMRAHCQAVGRTWNPRFDESGFPLLLTDLSSDEPPRCMVRTVQAAMRMRIPRQWAPRNPDPEDGWEPRHPIVGDETALRIEGPQPSEHWLPQLRSRPRGRDRRR